MPGITRANVIRLCRDNGIPVFEKYFSLVEAYGAEEAFLTGTFGGQPPWPSSTAAASATGAPGPVTRGIQAL